MKRIFATSALLVSLAALLQVGTAHAQTAPADPNATVVAQTAPEAAPPPAPQVAATGEWVQTADGEIWVPAGSQAVVTGGVPYVYLYTPSYGWTWYASPWGAGPYVRGAWISHPWPHGFHAWVHQGNGWGWYHGGHGGPVHVGVRVGPRGGGRPAYSHPAGHPSGGHPAGHYAPPRGGGGNHGRGGGGHGGGGGHHR